jgi:general stress protein 26
MPTTHFDGRFSQPGADATPWIKTEQVLTDAELYWLTTLRADGRPHITPLVGFWLDSSAYFTTGHDEQKARNLARSPLVALTTGANTWDKGHDVVVEGTATRLTDSPSLQGAAKAFADKYGAAWTLRVEGDALSEGDHQSGLWRITPSKVLSFAKDPHSQTTYTF